MIYPLRVDDMDTSWESLKPNAIFQIKWLFKYSGLYKSRGCGRDLEISITQSNADIDTMFVILFLTAVRSKIVQTTIVSEAMMHMTISTP
jgi:hypothetical protein